MYAQSVAAYKLVDKTMILFSVSIPYEPGFTLNLPTPFDVIQVTVGAPSFRFSNTSFSVKVRESEFPRVLLSIFHVKVLGGGLEAM